MPVQYDGQTYRVGPSSPVGSMPRDWEPAGTIPTHPAYPSAGVYRIKPARHHLGELPERLMLCWQLINSEWRRCAMLKTEAEILAGWT